MKTWYLLPLLLGLLVLVAFSGCKKETEASAKETHTTESSDTQCNHDHDHDSPGSLHEAEEKEHEHGSSCNHGAEIVEHATCDHDHDAEHDQHADSHEDSEHKHGAADKDDHDEDGHDEHKDDDHDEGHDHENCDGSHEQANTTVTPIAIPEDVRQNLGITFVRVESRPVRHTLRLPGTFELRPQARRDYRVMLGGRVELLVEQYQVVEAGAPLFFLESPAWQKTQEDLVAAYNAMRRSHANVDVTNATLEEAKMAVSILEKRVNNMAQANVRVVELEGELAMKQASLRRLEAELRATKVDFESAHTTYDVALNSASTLTGIPRNQLDPIVDCSEHLAGGLPPWRDITKITIFAEAFGIVDRIQTTNRGWAESGDLVIDTINPTALRFHADALQTDISRLFDGLPAQIVPPMGSSMSLQDTCAGTITLGFRAHSEQRTSPVFLIPDKQPSWIRPGVTAYLEVFVDGPEHAMTAVPEAATIRDGLETVMFVRNPEDPDQVLRINPTLGASDGRWVEVHVEGIRPGHEVVLGGVYPLMLASSTSGTRQQGGHFCGGVFHVGEH